MEKSKDEKSKSQSSKHKVFGIIQEHLAIIGIEPNLVEQSYPFNGKILFGFLLLGSSIYCTFVFIIYEAETFAEYTQSVYIGSNGVLNIFVLLIIILKIKRLYDFINDCDDLVNTSQSKTQTEISGRTEFQLKMIFF